MKPRGLRQEDTVTLTAPGAMRRIGDVGTQADKGTLTTQPFTSENARPLWFLHFKAEDVLWAVLTQPLTTGEVAGEEARR